MSKITFGRKFLVLILTSVLIWLGYLVAVLWAEDVLNPLAFIVLVSAQVLVGMAYIGGNTFVHFIRSKYFQPGLK